MLLLWILSTLFYNFLIICARAVIPVNHVKAFRSLKRLHFACQPRITHQNVIERKKQAFYKNQLKCKGFSKYLGDKIGFDVSSKAPSKETSVEEEL